MPKSSPGDFLNAFLTLRAGRPGKTFGTFLGISGFEGVETPVYGVCYRQTSGFTRGVCKNQ